MSLPPLNPESTASGIIVDPQTLERVIPSSRRKDGSVRKEQKIRAGYVPQEDVGAFRGRRQLEAEARRGVVPGAGGRPSAVPKPDNPFAQQPPQPIASKAQVKNEKRAVKRAEARHNWDSDSETDDDAEATRAAFAGLELADLKDDAAFPTLGGPKPAAKADVKASPSGVDKPAAATDKPKSVWNKNPPPAPAPAPPVAASPRAPANSKRTSSTPNASASTSTSPPSNNHYSREPSWRARGGSPRGRGRGSSTYVPPKPHPIQGGRKGPIGLAHPPPIEPTPARNTPRKSPASAAQQQQQQKSEPRVRREVHVREGGPLADRVRSLLLQNQANDGRSKRFSSATLPEH